MTKMNTFAAANSSAVRAYETATAKNPGGHAAWTRPIEERTIQLLMTGTLDCTYYVSADKLSKQTADTFTAILAKDPEFFAKAIVHARNDGCMRLVPIVGLVYLSTSPRKDLFHQAFEKTIRTPHDLATFVQWTRRAGIRKGLGQSVKRAISNWLNQMSEYHAIKYPLESGKEGFSLRDIIRVARPVPKDVNQAALFHWIVKGKTELNLELLPQVRAFEALKQATSAAEVQALITKGRIPHEVATGVVKPDVNTWKFIMHQMPHFALLRNLNTLHRAGVFKDQESVSFVANSLSQPNAVLRSKVLPFRYFEAIKQYSKNADFNQSIVESLITAMGISFQNMPEINGNVVVAVDVSGSMTNPISPKSETTYADIAALFGAALFKKSPTCKVLPFGDTVVPVQLSRQDSLFTIAKSLGNRNMSTNVGAPVAYARENRIPCDVFIGVTDNVEWYTKSNGYSGASAHGFYAEWLTYRQANPNARAFLLRIDPYEAAAAPPEDSGITLIYGWSSTVLEFIALAQKGFGAQVEAVRQISLTDSKKEVEDKSDE